VTRCAQPTPHRTAPTRPTNRPTSAPQLPPLPRRQRIGAAIASALISTVLLSSVVIGLTGTPDSASPVAARATPATRT